MWEFIGRSKLFEIAHTASNCHWTKMEWNRVLGDWLTLRVILVKESVAFKDWDIYNLYTSNLRCWFGFQILQMSIQLSICVMWWTKKFDPWRLHLTNYGTSFIANIVVQGNTAHLQGSSGVLGLTLWLISIYLSFHPSIHILIYILF